MYNDHGIEVEVNTSQTLAILRENREKHGAIVKEAREGYIKAASQQMEKALGQLREGKVISLSFGLAMPQDHTADYDAAIRTLEMHVGETLDMTSQQVAMFVMDRWEWRREFLYSNSNYSATATRMLQDEPQPSY